MTSDDSRALIESIDSLSLNILALLKALKDLKSRQMAARAVRNCDCTNSSIDPAQLENDALSKASRVQKKTDEGTAMSPELHDRKPRVDSVDEILFLSLLCGLLGQPWLIYGEPRTYAETHGSP